MCSLKAAGFGNIVGHIVHFFVWSTLEIEMEPFPLKTLGMLTTGGGAALGEGAGRTCGAWLGCLCNGLTWLPVAAPRPRLYCGVGCLGAGAGGTNWGAVVNFVMNELE